MHPLVQRISVLVATTAVLAYKVNSVVKEPYLDEFFHIPQAQHYCSGNFHIWDPKITTPFGLYALSYIYIRLLTPLTYILSLLSPTSTPTDALCTPALLRSLNAVGVAVILPLLIYRISRIGYGRGRQEAADTAASVAGFPLVWFFAGLFYTDVWGLVFLVAGWERVVVGKGGRWEGWLGAGLSGVAVLFRQTNVLWTAFLGVVWVVGREEKDKGEKEVDLQRIIGRAWEEGTVYDPALSETTVVGDILTLPLAALHSPLTTLLAFLPFLTVLLLFLAFVITNGSIVLGDKSAHTAVIHLPQLLYFTLFTTFISWPLFLRPTLPIEFLDANFPVLTTLPKNLTVQRVARTVGSVLVIIGMGVVVHKNTVLHPYLLADNRHYPFYIFQRTVLRYWFAKYLAVPLYFAGGWMVWEKLCSVKIDTGDSAGNKKGVSTLWALAYAVAFSASVVGAGLVEFRYFVPGWVVWRVAVGGSGSGEGAWRTRVEWLWFGIVNWVTVWLFLRRGFEWVSEPGKVQRFMW
ncbi:alpha-2-glucosyltransferase Alg10 [Peziza echinospora]|nr:alpha-2-glucosyltransferase Alg10 [Peziza echinospora]